MDDFGILARDFGFRPQGKSAPMSASKGPATTTATSVGIGSVGGSRSTSSATARSAWNSTPSGGSLIGDDDGLFGPSSHNQSRPEYGGLSGYDDVFGGPPRYSNQGRAPPPPAPTPSSAASPFDSLFPGSKESPTGTSSMPVYDKPVYDDDIFDGVPGLKSTGAVRFNDVFASMSNAQNDASQYDDLLGNFGRAEPELKKGSRGNRSGGTEREVTGFDDLIPGFGGSSPPPNRGTSESSRTANSAVPPTKSSSSVLDEPFVVIESTSVPVYSSSGLFTDPLEHISKPNNSGTTKADGSSVSGGVFDDINAFDGLTKSAPFSDKDRNNKSPSRMKAGNGPAEKATMSDFDNTVHRKMPSDDYQPPHQTLFDIPTGPSNSHKTTGRSGFNPKNGNAYEASLQDMSPESDGNLDSSDDVWLTVEEIPLFTQPTSAPPPSRPPPPKPVSFPKADKSSAAGSSAKRKVGVADSVKSFGVSSVDELEDFAMGKPRNYADERVDVLSSEEEIETNSAAAASAAAMKEAMDRAEAKFKHAKEVRERERDLKGVKSRESAQQEDENARKDAQEREYREKQERLDRERELREREEKEREQKRLEKEREREREEREKARQAVERATREARERAAAEARLKAERVAVEKVNAEARERAERAAVQRAQAEARERAATEARERAEKAALEVKQREKAAVARAAQEVRYRAERAAVERAAEEARARAAEEARLRAAREKQQQQQKNENDLESFFSARPNSAPRQRAATSDPAFDTQFQSKPVSEGTRRASVSTPSTMRKASSTTNIVDDLSSVFGAATSTEEFQEIEGETQERRRARLERQQRTHQRAQQALAEKNARDMQTQRDQAERHRIAETLDIEIKRWAAGKEGNLRALLSTLQYVLWPECGWQPVSLTDLITAASVKKVYRKATLSVHPDKVQQKGANLQQKYIAEKVFDLLKEAYNKFNSEELF
ncbi:hypothetical protein AAC387_Pa04g2544 [Persea americana]